MLIEFMSDGTPQPLCVPSFILGLLPCVCVRESESEREREREREREQFAGGTEGGPSLVVP